MALKEQDFLLNVWAFDKAGNKVFPYKGEKGEKKGLYSVNFTSDTKNYEGYTEERLIKVILEGRFKTRGTIRMLPLNYKPGAERSAFAPKCYKGKVIKNY